MVWDQSGIVNLGYGTRAGWRGYKTEKDLNPETILWDDLGFDSLDEVELVMALEETFDCEINDSDAENVRTVGDCYELIEKVAR